MPGNNAGDGDYYCDANLGNNIWCPEYDTMEGNKYTIATTLHTCNGGNGYWDSCDRGGCQVNAFNVDSSMMCPEDRCKINTNKPFVISHFQNSQQANTWMGQEGRDASFNMCNDGGYLTSRTLNKQTPGWVKRAGMQVSTCAMMEDISQTWPSHMVEWSSQLLFGEVAESTWAGLME